MYSLHEALGMNELIDIDIKAVMFYELQLCVLARRKKETNKKKNQVTKWKGTGMGSLG